MDRYYEKIGQCIFDSFVQLRNEVEEADEKGHINASVMTTENSYFLFKRFNDADFKNVDIILTSSRSFYETSLASYARLSIYRAVGKYAEYFDGFSIGSNDLTQTTLSVDRDSGLLASLFDEGDEAVMKMLSLAIHGAHFAGRPVGICGQAPSDRPEIAQFIIEQGINSISLNPDAVLPFLRNFGIPQKLEDAADKQAREIIVPARIA